MKLKESMVYVKFNYGKTKRTAEALNINESSVKRVTSEKRTSTVSNQKLAAVGK